VQFLISTSKSAPNLLCFERFDFEMYSGVHFSNISTSKSAPNLQCFQLRATVAYNFSSLISSDGSAPAALASQLFDLPEPENAEKHI
jgi:hypothetical protein